VQFRIWDTNLLPRTNPAFLSSCSEGRSNSFNLHRVTGITFLVEAGIVIKIHAHTTSDPSALHLAWIAVGYDGLARHVTWVYVPIVPNDPVESIAFGHQVLPDADDHSSLQCNGNLLEGAIMLRTAMGHDSIIGTADGFSEGFLQFSDNPNDFYYTESRESIIEMFSTYKNHSFMVSSSLPGICHSEFSPTANQGCRCLYSEARLENVESVQFFYPEGENPMKGHGLIFHYKDGTVRAVGECRVQVHKTRTISLPTHVAFTIEGAHPVPGYNHEDPSIVFSPVSMEFGGPELLETRGTRDGWVSYEMAGLMQFWFGDWGNHVSVTGWNRYLGKEIMDEELETEEEDEQEELETNEDGEQEELGTDEDMETEDDIENEELEADEDSDHQE
jgi:hypothetical protein